MSIILELGPGETFLYDTPGGTTTNNLPEGLKDLEAGVGLGRFFQTIYSLNFGCNGAYILAARTVNGAIIRRNNLPPQLEAWLIDPVTHTCKRDIATLAVKLGPNGSFYARDKDSYRWYNLPDALEEAIQQRLCPAGWTARPDFVILGADGAFIYSNDCGGASHALGNYPKLQELVLGLQRANVGGLTGFGLIQWVSMSIYQPGHFIALHNTGHHVAELSPGASQALNSMTGTFPLRNTAPQQAQQRTVSQPIMQQPSPTVTQQASPPPMTHAPMPTRKPLSPPVSQPQTVPRPQPNHLVSSPIPQTHQPRPMAVHQTSAPVPHVQPAAARPVSTQVSPTQAPRPNTNHLVSSPIPQTHQPRPTAVHQTSAPVPRVQPAAARPVARPVSTQVPATQAPRPNARNRLSSANWKAAGQMASNLLKKSNEGQGGSNTTSSNSYSNTASNTNVNNSTYAVGGASGTAPSTTYVVPVDSGSAAPVYSVTAPMYAADSGTVPMYTADSGTVPMYVADNGTVPMYVADGGTVPVYDVPAGDTGVYEAAGDSSAYSAVGDDGSFVAADDSGVADAVAASDIVSTGVDSGSGFWTGLGSVFSSDGS